MQLRKQFAGFFVYIRFALAIIFLTGRRPRSLTNMFCDPQKNRNSFELLKTYKKLQRQSQSNNEFNTIFSRFFMLIRYQKYVKKFTFVSGLILLSICVSVQANDAQKLNSTSTSGNQATFQLSLNSNGQNNGHSSENKIDGKTEIDLSAGDYVSAYDKSAKALLDIEVNDNNGVEVGVITDYLIKAGEIEYAVVLVKDVPVLDDKIVKKYVAVPYNELLIDDKSDLSRAEFQVKLILTQQQINQMPEFMFNSNKDSEQANDNVAKTAEVNYDISAKEIIDMKVFGKSGDLLGLIQDLIISNNDSITYAVISSGVLGISDKLIAAPFQELQIHKTEEKVILNVTNQALENAPGFQMRNP